MNNKTKKVNTADAYSKITKDQYKPQEYITKELNRVEKLQNLVIGSSDKIANTVMNGYRSTALNDQTSVLTNSTADLYSSDVARQNLDIVNNQVTDQLSQIASENTAGAISDVSSFFTKGVGSLYQLENYKRQLALKEAESVFNIKKGIADLNLGWSDYNLNKNKLNYTTQTNKRQEKLAAEKLKYTIESNKRQEAISAPDTTGGK